MSENNYDDLIDGVTKPIKHGGPDGEYLYTLEDGETRVERAEPTSPLLDYYNDKRKAEMEDDRQLLREYLEWRWYTTLGEDTPYNEENREFQNGTVEQFLEERRK